MTKLSIKKKLIYLKSAKTGGTSMVELLKKNSSNVLHCAWPHEIPTLVDVHDKDIIILANVPVIEKFKEKFKRIYDDAYKILIFRNPFDRVLSAYNYLELNKDFIYYLKNLPEGPTGDNPSTYNSDYVHFSLSQLDSMCLDKSILTNSLYRIISFEYLSENVSDFLSESGCTFTKIKWLNKTKKYKKKCLSKEEKLLILKIFKNDIEFYNKLQSRRSSKFVNSYRYSVQRLFGVLKKMISF